MRRREFVRLVAAAAIAWSFTARAQQKSMPVIGFLAGGSPGPFGPYVDAFRQGLTETSYVEGRNVAIEYRWAEGRYDRLPALAAHLVSRKVDLIVASGALPSALAAKNAPRRSRLSSPASATRSGSASSPASPGRAVTSRALT